MKTMEDYANFCTAEQTCRAYKLGAPIKNEMPIPTTQQMIGWLRKRWDIQIYALNGMPYCFINGYKDIIHGYIEYDSYEQAELAAIDTALDYLEKGGTK